MIKENNKELINPFSKSIEYVIEDKTVATLDYSLIYDRIEIDNIIVLEEFRGRGIGSKLMSYLIHVAEDNKVVNITLEVRISNIIAINLYKKFGLKEVALRKYYYGDEDAILMEKQVI